MNESGTLFILCGEAFSGKSSLSKRISEVFGAEVIGRDMIYFSLEKSLALESTPDEDDTELWNHFWSVAIQGIKNHLTLGNSVVVDDNLLFRRQREELYELAKATRSPKILIYLDIPNDVLLERKEKNKMTKERHDVPSAWLIEDANEFERPGADETPVVVTETMDWEEVLIEIKARLQV
jgi:predicted kinase